MLHSPRRPRVFLEPQHMRQASRGEVSFSSSLIDCRLVFRESCRASCANWPSPFLFGNGGVSHNCLSTESKSLRLGFGLGFSPDFVRIFFSLRNNTLTRAVVDSAAHGVWRRRKSYSLEPSLRELLPCLTEFLPTATNLHNCSNRSVKFFHGVERERVSRQLAWWKLVRGCRCGWWCRPRGGFRFPD
jgi:hypothetical protein